MACSISLCHFIFPIFSSPATTALEEEEILMQALADEEEDARCDDGAIEINSDEKLRRLKSLNLLFLIPPGCMGKISQVVLAKNTIRKI
jgi:hypothetical protein